MIPQKQTWEQVGNLHKHNLNNLLQLRENLEFLRQKQDLHQLLVKKLVELLPGRSLHNLHQRLEINLVELPQLKGKEDNKHFRNKPRIIKFRVQVLLAVKKGLQFNSKNLQRQELQSNNLSQVLRHQELARLFQLQNLLQSLSFRAKRAS
jgi:hypothetical protein